MSNQNVSSGHFIGDNGLPVDWTQTLTPVGEWPEQPSLKEALEIAKRTIVTSHPFYKMSE